MDVPSSPDISRKKRRNQPTVRVVVFHALCYVPRPRLIKSCLDLHAGQVHIVGRATLPSLNMGVLSSCHSP